MGRRGALNGRTCAAFEPGSQHYHIVPHMPEPSARDAQWWERFEALLDEQTAFPSTYVFKFIVPLDQVATLEALFPDYEPTYRASAKGNYVSLTMQPVMESAEAVIAVYRRAAQVEGVIML